MDGTTIEHSDSDSGESWTLLESNLNYGDDTLNIPENTAQPTERKHADNQSENDEDTDGISIISDSEPEVTPFNITDEAVPTEQQDTSLLVSPPPLSMKNNNESMNEETDFLGDNIKYKTYVHRRNPKVSTILDVIMLGTFIITAGMALGHLFSCKNECTTQTSVNKILSNLYKLQEENAYLRNKLKEITEATNHEQEHEWKSLNNKAPTKQYRCKKIFEEPVIKNNKVTVKCVDDKKLNSVLHDTLKMPEHEKEFLNDVDKMKKIYDQNKEWLDKEVKKQYEDFEKLKDHGSGGLETNRQINLDKQIEPKFIPLNLKQPDDKEDSGIGKSHRQKNLEKQLGPIYFELPLKAESDITKEHFKTESSSIVKSHRQTNLELQLGVNQHTHPTNPDFQSDPLEFLPEKKITYADSLKTDKPLQRNQRNEKSDEPSRWIKDHSGKRKYKDDVSVNLSSFSEDHIIIDDRYTGPKIKHEKKKRDRQKSHKKQKRNNKYEQWEMKGGYLKDFDEASIISSQDNDVLLSNPEMKFLNHDFENYITKFIESDTSTKDLPKVAENVDEKPNKLKKHSLKDEKKVQKTKDSEWYDRRSALRAEARTKLEHELFGENTPNNAAWYFRRMQKREQCRAQKNNSTFKKFAKRKMNFKMKR